MGGNPALLRAMREVNGDAYFPPGVSAALHGHFHLFEAIDFASSHPPSLIAGHGGDLLAPPFPSPFPLDTSPAAGVKVEHLNYAQSFGYLVLDRQADEWLVHVRAADGSPLRECTLVARHLRCRD